MDFRPSPYVEKIRAEFRAWLDRHLSSDWRGHDALARLPGEERIEVMRAWQRTLHEGRWLVVHWPEDLGGRGLSMLENWIVQEELRRAEAPPLLNAASLSIVGPTLRTFTSDEQKRSIPRDLDERPDSHARAPHVEDHRREPLVLRGRSPRR